MGTIGAGRSCSVMVITPEQDEFERDVIWTMYSALKSVRDEGYSDWQTLTSFIANTLLDQDNPMGMLKQLRDDVKLKMDLMRRMEITNEH